MEKDTHDLMALAAAAQELQAILIEMEVRISFQPSSIQLVVHKKNELRITMDGDRDNHSPHIHIDLGKNKHVGSYTIHDGVRVAGEVNKYDRPIKKWIAENREILERVYRAMRADGYDPADVVILKNTRFPEK